MNSRVSWSVDGIDPTVRERAEAAARRAGMSLNDWLNSTVGESAPPNLRNASAPPSPTGDVADIHQRLDSITRQIERISQPTSRNDGARGQGVAHQLNDAISRLDARLSQISNPQAQRQNQNRQQRQNEAVERAASEVYSAQAHSAQAYPSQASHPSQVYPQAQAAPAYRQSPPLSPASMDFAVAEIAARQNELDAPPQGAMPPRHAPPIAPAIAPPPPGPDFSALERHLFKITSQIESLQRPDIEQSIAAFRSELSEIRAAITAAMPHQAIESIEGEIRSLARRIDDSRQSGIDNQVLGNIESALNEIRDVLRSLKSAEQLAGYDQAIRNLGAKLDTILRTNDDPGTVQQLESAIAALRGIVSNIASNDALVRLSDDVQLLSSKVDQVSRANTSNNNSFAALESRIAALTSALESRERPQYQDNSEQIEGALRGLSDRIDRMQVGSDSASAFAHLEQRVSYLLERLESSSSDRNSGNLGRVEEGLQDILRHLENQHVALASFADNQHAALASLVQNQHAALASFADNQHATLASFANNQQQRGADPQDDGLIDLVKRELSDIRFSQTKTDRATQDSLEAVHSTLHHVVDRLALIEGDLRAVRPAPPQPAPSAAPLAPAPAAEPELFEPEISAPHVAVTPQPKPELPNPAASQIPHFAAAPRNFHAAESVAPPPLAASAPPAPPPLAISEILVPAAAPRPSPSPAPDLPPDHPLEPGTRPGSRVASPSERIAASESAISEIPAAPKEPVSSSSFIAAARRAAQAAAAQPVDKKGKPIKADNARDTKDGGKSSSTISTRIRSLLVGASVVVIVLGTFKMAMNLLDIGNFAQIPGLERSADQPAAPPSADNGAKAPAPEQFVPAPSMTSPTPIGRQSQNSAAPAASDANTTVEIPQAQTPAAPAASPISGNDITGAIPNTNSRKGAMLQIPQSERLPDQIGGPTLRAAALKGDPTAAYEVGLRFAEGKGVPQNLDEAAKWYDRAAQTGIIPAVFRLGTLYEKGMGVKKDADVARRYYLQAAERGNAKAMHNLAVLDADGGGKGPDYKSASTWFRKAADRGVADSQFNLGILYARGIGVEQNLAESFKWFSLAAAQGDADAGHKRDDIAKRLDAQSLAAAKLAIQTFTAEPQPDDAINVATPAGGWDSTAATAAAPKSAAKPAAPKRASTARL